MMTNATVDFEEEAVIPFDHDEIHIPRFSIMVEQGSVTTSHTVLARTSCDAVIVALNKGLLNEGAAYRVHVRPLND